MHAGFGHPTHATEALQQAGTLFRAHTRNVLELAAAHAHACTLCAHAGDGKAVGFIANLRHQHQGRRVASQIDFLAAIGEHQIFQAHLAALALFHAHDAREVQAKGLENFACNAHLPFAAVDQHQIGKAAFAQANAFRQLAVASHQHLAHGGIVVAGGDALDVVTPVFRSLHFVMVKHHA